MVEKTCVVCGKPIPRPWPKGKRYYGPRQRRTARFGEPSNVAIRRYPSKERMRYCPTGWCWVMYGPYSWNARVARMRLREAPEIDPTTLPRPITLGRVHHPDLRQAKARLSRALQGKARR